MSTALILSLVAVAAALVAVFIAARSGPRVTRIETRKDNDNGESRGE